jgi:hypothetical protein
MCNEYNFKISAWKTKEMDFRREDPMRIKILILDAVIKQAAHFEYLGSDTDLDKDTDNGLYISQATCGRLNATLKRKS